MSKTWKQTEIQNPKPTPVLAPNWKWEKCKITKNECARKCLHKVLVCQLHLVKRTTQCVDLPADLVGKWDLLEAGSTNPGWEGPLAELVSLWSSPTCLGWELPAAGVRSSPFLSFGSTNGRQAEAKGKVGAVCWMNQAPDRGFNACPSGTVLSSLYWLSRLSLTTALGGNCYCYAHSTAEEAEAQGGWVIHPMSLSASLILKPSPPL